MVAVVLTVMASLSSAKTLGGIGGILVFIPGLSFVGWILILVALNEISDVVQDRNIFDNALIAGITAVLGAVVLLVFLVSGSFGALPGFGGFYFATTRVQAAVGILAAFWVFAIVSAVFLKRAYDKTAQRLNVNAFATAGLLYLIGALTVIILIGFAIIFIALIFQVVAYFSIENRPTYAGVSPPPQPFAPPPSPMQQPTTAQQAQPDFRFCPKCGTRLARIADYCTNCGAKQS